MTETNPDPRSSVGDKMKRLYIWLWRSKLPRKCKVVKIRGWRTFLIDDEYGQRMTIQLIFFWEESKTQCWK